MPTRFTISFETDEVLAVLPSGLHDFTCELLDPPSNGDGARHPQPRPFSITPLKRIDDHLWGYDVVIQPDPPASAELESRLEQHLAPYLSGVPRRFGRSEVRLVSDIAPLRWDRTTTWATLTRVPVAERGAIALCTPVLTRTRATHHVVPDIRTLLDGVLQRWHAFDPATVPDLDPWSARLETLHVEARMLPYRAVRDAGATAGLVGHLVLDLSKNTAADQQRICALIAAAEATGVGSGTAFGMGVVRRMYADRPLPTYCWTVSQTWAGRRRRVIIGCAGGTPCSPLPGQLPIELPSTHESLTGAQRSEEGGHRQHPGG